MPSPSLPKPSPDVVKLVTTLLEKTPIYQHAIQPGAKEFGQAAAPGAKAIGETFSSVSILGRDIVVGTVANLAFGYAYIRDKIIPRIAERLKNIDPERIVLPRPAVAVPALESLALVVDEESLREMYINLLVTSMDSSTSGDAHPAYADIIRHMTPDEAKIAEHFAHKASLPTISVSLKCITPERQTYPSPALPIAVDKYASITLKKNLERPLHLRAALDNLRRLGLIEHPEQKFLMEDDLYEPLIQSDKVRLMIEEAEEALRAEGKAPLGFDRRFVKGYYTLTDLGANFCVACILPHPSSESNEPGAPLASQEGGPEKVSEVENDRPQE